MVIDYMTKTNRPYSLINIFDNLHKKISKKNLEKLLDTLTQNGDI